MGIRTIAPEENSPAVTVRVWVRVSFFFGGGAIFLGSNCPRTVKMVYLSKDGTCILAGNFVDFIKSIINF